MPMARITKVSGENNLYHIHVLDGHEGHPDQGLPGGGVDPGYGQGRPRPGIPSNELPEGPPPTLLPGYTLVMLRSAHGHWEYAAIAPGSPPPRPLPGPPAHGPGRPDRPDNSLPGRPLRPDQSLPPAPGTPENPIAPTPAPKA